MAHCNPGTELSKPGYLKRRMLLQPEAIQYLIRNHNRKFYADGAGRTMNGHLVLAVDGTNVLIPSTKETLETYGTSGRKGSRSQAALGLSCVHDVLSRMVLDVGIFRAHFDERAAARSQLAHVRETVGKIPFLVTMDCGYPSLPLLLWMSQQGIPFVVRISSGDYKEERSRMEGDDCDMEVLFTRQRIASHRGTADAEAMERAGSMMLRFVRIRLEDGQEEMVVTNLPREEFSAEQIKRLYELRWGVETEFDVLKNCLQLENFTGTKPRLIQQDIYATVYVSNVASYIALDANRTLEGLKRKRAKPRKNAVAINRCFALGALKNDMIHILLVDDPAEKEALFLRLYRDILKHVEPVRPNRSYPRRKGRFASKYPITHKRLF